MQAREGYTSSGGGLQGQIFAPALFDYTPFMALRNVCIDLHGGRKCRKIAWSNRGHPIPVDYVGKMRKMHSHPGRLYNQA